MRQRQFGSASIRKDIDEFFAHWAWDRHTATQAVTAGLVSAALLTLTTVAGSFVSLLRNGWAHSNVLALCGLAVCSGSVFFGTLKQITSAPIIGSFLGMGIVAWLLERHEVAIAAIVLVPFVFGFLTAARGLQILNDGRRREKA